MTSGYIAVDWGSTHLRAWRICGDQCLDSRRMEAGITRLDGRAPAAVLAEITEGWRHANEPVLMAGMVGSDAGWVPAPYLDCPARFSDLAQRRVSAAPGAWIIPGLCVRETNNHNVMRGEETQLLGARQLASSSLYVMPGTHCKWVRASDERVEGFDTAMTGELHALLLRHSLIGAGLPAQQRDEPTFQRGLAQGLEDASLVARLFQVRAAHVLGELARERVSEFLSGLLIGAEVAALGRGHSTRQPVTVVAGPDLGRRYQQALMQAGYQVQLLDGDSAFLTGIRSIAHAVAD